MNNIFSKPSDNTSGQTRNVVGQYSSTDERGAISSGAVKRGASKSIHVAGFYSVPDEGSEIMFMDNASEEEPIVHGELNSYGIRKFDGKLLKQGERYLTNRGRTANIIEKEDGKISIISFTDQFVKINEGGDLENKNSLSSYQSVDIDPKSGSVSISVGNASYSSEEVAYEKLGEIKIDKSGVIHLN